MDDVWSLIRSIPPGKVASYGTVGEHLRPPTSGRAVGRWMRNCPEGLPWWRVVGRTGRLPIGKIDPALENMQEQMLRKEGVEVTDGKIDMDRYACWVLD